MDLPSAPGATFAVRVRPNASATEYAGYDEAREAFVFRLAAVPDKGKANKELLDHLKREHGLACEIIAGHTSRKKLVKITS